jgi:macrolide transport system ATP-binding/permease protein
MGGKEGAAMSRLGELWRRMQMLARRDKFDRELEEEMRLHREMKERELTSSGVDADEARYAANRGFGNALALQERGREAWGWRWLEDLVQDVRFGARMLRKNPGFTAVAVITLALGIGANTAIFSVVNTILLRPLPVHDPEQLVTLSFQLAGSASTPVFSYPDYRDIREQAAAAFSDILAYRVGLDGLSVNGQADRIMVHYVTGNYFTLLGVKPALGRLIQPSEGEAPMADPVLVLGYSYWQTRFAGDPNVIGKRVLIDGHSMTIVGVAPQQFRSVQAVLDVQAYLPLGMVLVEGNYPHEVLASRNMRMFSLVGRLQPEVTVSQARTVLKIAGKRISDSYPTLLEGMTMDAEPESLGRIPLGGSRRLVFVATLFLGMAALVLVLACVNLTNLLMVRATGRGKELAMRVALGCSRDRLIRQLLTESAVLTFLGAMVGLFLGVWTSGAFSTPEVQGIAMHLEGHFDWRVFAYGLAATTVTGLLLGVLPALLDSRADLTRVSREGGQRFSAGGRRLRSALVAMQVAGSFLLLMVAGLLTRSLENAQRLDLGFDPNNIVNFSLDPHYLGYDSARGGQFYQELLRRVRALPGVESASLGCCGPMSPSPLFAPMRMDGHTPPAGQSDPTIFFNQVSHDFFETLHIPIVRGRSFLTSDDRDAQRVAIINQTMAERYWPGQDPIGRKFHFAGDSRPSMEVAGVVKDGKYLGISDRPQAYFYVPLEQNYGSSEVLLVRSRTAAETVMAEVRKEIVTLAPGLPVIGVETMLQQLDESGGLGSLRRSALLAGALGGLGMALAVVGVYGVIAYSVAQRTHEIGIRVALGASQRDIASRVVGQGMAMTVVGLVLGLAGALSTTRFLSSLLYGIRPGDPLTIGCVAAVLSSAALAACYIPARRAMRVDPMVALRHE